MTEPPKPDVVEKVVLTTTEKLSIINALMTQDRTEIRSRHEDIFKLTYLVAPALFGIALYAPSHPEKKWLAIFGVIFISLLYIFMFLTFRRWLEDTRACLAIREAFYKNPALFHAEIFEPIRSIQPKDRCNAIKDSNLWFPFGIIVAMAISAVVYLLEAV